MATFSQWNKKRLIRRVTWVCGPESALLREIVAEYRAQGIPWYPYYADLVTREADMWDSILTWPRGPSTAAVWGAEQLKMPERVITVTETIPELARVVFFSREEDFARTGEGEKKALAPHLAAIQASKDGQLIRCCRPSSEEDLLQLVASWWPGAGNNLASVLLARTAGDLHMTYQACKTAEAAGLPPSADYLDMACQGTPAARFADYLLAGKRKEAATEARHLSEASTGGTLKYLSGQLDKLRQYHAMTSTGMDPDRIARKGIPRWQQKALAPYAAAYSADQVIRCRRVLALAEEAFRAGARDGVLEAVAALW